MKNERIIATIKKLLALAESENEHEAKLAADKANEMLLRYNLSIQQIGGDSTVEEDIIDNGRAMPTEAKYVSTILSRHFHVEVLSGYRRKDDQKIRCTRFFGEPTNVEVAVFTYGFLIKAFRNAFRDYAKAFGVSKKARQAYYMGIMQGLNEQLSQTKRKVEQEMGLVLVKNPAIYDYINQKYNAKFAQRTYRYGRDDHAQYHGQETGRSMQITKGLKSSSGSSQGLMIGSGK